MTQNEPVDAGYVRIPTTLLIAVISGSTLFGGGVYGIVRPGDYDKLKNVREDIAEIRATANAALTLASQNGQRTNDNRQLIFDNTRSRYSADEAYKDWKAQGERDDQQDRRLNLLERQADAR